MSANVSVLKVVRPKQPVSTGDGLYDDWEDADFLLVTLDRYGGSGLSRTVVQFNFADYAGLQTEWEAGVATTVLQAAVTTYLGGDPGWLPERLTSAQRAATDVIYAEA